MIKTKLNLTDYQLKKIANAFKDQTSVRIRFSYEQITGKINIRYF